MLGSLFFSCPLKYQEDFNQGKADSNLRFEKTVCAAFIPPAHRTLQASFCVPRDTIEDFNYFFIQIFDLNRSLIFSGKQEGFNKPLFLAKEKRKADSMRSLYLMFWFYTKGIPNQPKRRLIQKVLLALLLFSLRSLLFFLRDTPVREAVIKKVLLAFSFPLSFF